jgi:subtilisin family serine protease
MTTAELDEFASLALQASDDIHVSIPNGECPYACYREADGSPSQEGPEPHVALHGFHHLPIDDVMGRCRVAILDTGVDPDHPELRGRVDTTWTAYSSSRAVNPHGTHCAGIVAASQVNGVTRVGCLPTAKVGSYKVLDDRGSGTERTIAAGLEAAIRDGYRVFSLSLGGSTPMPTLERMIRAVTKAGGVVVAAAGNAGVQSPVQYPAAYPEVIAVAAVDSRFAVAGFSSRGDYVDIAAVGVGVLSTVPGGHRARMSGTSMACPVVAAAVAYAMESDPSRDSMTSVLNWLVDHAADAVPSTVRREVGHGVVNVAGLVGTPPPTPLPPTIRLPLTGLPADLIDALKGIGVTGVEIGFTRRSSVLPDATLGEIARVLGDVQGLVRRRVAGGVLPADTDDWIKIITLVGAIILEIIKARNPRPTP